MAKLALYRFRIITAAMLRVLVLSLLCMSVQALLNDGSMLGRNACAQESHSDGHGDSHGSGGSDRHGSGHDSHAGGHESGHEGKGKGAHSGGNADKGHHKGGAGKETIEDKIFHGGDQTESGHRGAGSSRPETRSDNKPWAKGRLPEVELGRLNVARAPGHVLARALNEVLQNTRNGTLAINTDWYSMKAEDAAVYLKSHPDLVRVDSPLENLALFKQVLGTGRTELPGVSPSSTIDLAAILLGSAADKSIPINKDTVEAVSIILELSVSNEDLLAHKAEAIRNAIKAAHDTQF